MKKKAIALRNESLVDIPAIREEILSYLAETSIGRQGEIAAEVGVRRETICAYSNGRREINDVHTLQRLYEWMERDKKNGHVAA